jgi:apolipoprotein N-acyltransferase
MLLCGAAYGACFPPLALRPLAWVVLVPAFVALLRATPRRAAALGGLLGFAGACATVAWLPRTVVVYFGQPLPVGLALFVGVTLVTVVPYYAAVGAFLAAAGRRWSAALPLVVGAAWVSAELARATLLGGNPWVLAGYSQVGIAPLVQVADCTGVYGLSFAIVAVNVALADVWRRGQPALPGLLIAAALVATVLGYGAARLAREAVAPVPATAVVIVQGNLDLGAQWRSEQYGQNLDTYLRLTLEALRATPAPLVVWPESAMTFFIDDEPLYRAAISRVLSDSGTTLVSGGVAARDGHEPYTNAAFAIAPDGAVRARYDKRRLLPFAESFPLPELDLLRRNFGRVREFTPGHPSAPLPTPAGPAGVLICNEAFYPSDARARVREGARVLLNLSNDSWVGDRQFSTIAFDMSALRAVETRRWLLRASTAGPSAVVDPSGQLAAVSPLFEPAVLRGAVGARDDLTPYVRWGDVFAYACGAVTLLAVAALYRGRRVGGTGRD